jgi:hypothetical protein
MLHLFWSFFEISLIVYEVVEASLNVSSSIHFFSSSYDTALRTDIVYFIYVFAITFFDRKHRLDVCQWEEFERPSPSMVCSNRHQRPTFVRKKTSTPRVIRAPRVDGPASQRCRLLSSRPVSARSGTSKRLRAAAAQSPRTTSAARDRARRPCLTPPMALRTSTWARWNCCRKSWGGSSWQAIRCCSIISQRSRG